MARPLVPVGKQVKRTESYLWLRKHERGAGYSDAERNRFKQWERNERNERWTVAEHVTPGTEHNPWLHQPIYKLTKELPDGRTQVCYSIPDDWEEA